MMHIALHLPSEFYSQRASEDEFPFQKLFFLTVFVLSFLEVLLKGRLDSKVLGIQPSWYCLDPECTNTMSAQNSSVLFADCMNVMEALVHTDSYQQ